MTLHIRRRSTPPVPFAYATRLFWSGAGEVACAKHAPQPSSAQWSASRWQPVPDALTRRYQCEHCYGRAYRPEPRLVRTGPLTAIGHSRSPRRPQ
jgi:hypothetical protein